MSTMLRAGVKRIGQYAKSSFAVVGFGVTAAGAASYYQRKKIQREQLKPQKRVLVLPFHKLKLVRKDQQTPLDDLLLEGRNGKEFEKIAVEDLVEILHQASSDENIVGIYGQFGHGGSFGGGAADAEEIRNALRIFRESHRVHAEPNLDHQPVLKKKGNNVPKPMVAYADTFGSSLQSHNPDYYLASIFREIHLQTQGTLDLFGYGTSTPFLKKTLEKYGAKVHCYKHGAYKNAPNLFTHSGFTKAHRQNVENYLFALNDYQNERIALARKRGTELTPDFWKLLQNSGSFTAEAALKMGLIDGVVEYNPLENILYPRTKEEEEEKIKGDSKKKKPVVTQLGDYRQIVARRKRLQAQNDSLVNVLDKVAAKLGSKAQSVLQSQKWYQNLLPKEEQQTASNNIKTPKETIALLTIRGAIDAKAVRKLTPRLEKIKKNKSVKAVVVRVDSPGGTIDASETILQELKNLPHQPKIVVSFGNVAASGGYYIASHADQIFANQTTITGSIGVYGIRFDLSGVAEQYGVRFGQVTTSEFALNNDVFSHVTKAQHANHTRGVDRAYERFRQVVSTGRDLDDDYVKSLAEGRIWTGQQAKQNGLVDEIGGWKQAIDFCQRNYTTSGKAKVVEITDDKGFFAELGKKALEQANVSEDSAGVTSSCGLLEEHGISLPKTLPKKAFGVYLTIDENAAIRSLLDSGSDSEDK